MADRPTILVILGPTASGKSAVADAIARHIGAEILSVDSMQVYRGMNIGTAKPTIAEQALVRHHLIDLVEPDELFTVARFVELADAVIAGSVVGSLPLSPRAAGVTTSTARGANGDCRNPLIATGGTPLYYKALFEGLFDGPRADDEIRQRLARLPNDRLHAQLTSVDPVAASRIHQNDSRRMIRALEVFEITGKPITSFQTDWASPSLRHPAKFFGLTWDKEEINRRINARVKAMIAAGWVEETRGLLEKYGELSMTAAEATGYRELIDHLAGKCTLADAIEQIKISTRQLARRQMKWFRRFANVKWLPGDRPPEEIAAEIAAEII